MYACQDAQVINEWRFSKLKEFRDGNVAFESEAFDRYMQNVGLLEEVFRVTSESKDQIEVEQSSREQLNYDGDNNINKMVLDLKLKVRSNPATTENFRKRIQYIVDQGLKKLGKLEIIEGTDDISDTEGQGRAIKRIKSLKSEKAIAISDLNDKLNKARNEDELIACWEMASKIFKWNTKKRESECGESTCRGNDVKDDSSSAKSESHFLPLKWVNPVMIEQEDLCRIDAQFPSLEEIENM